jgi:hypothetical protein
MVPPNKSFVQQPAKVGRELLRFRTGKQHAKVQGVEKTVVADPSPLLDQFRMHDGDLTCWSAEVMNLSLSQNRNDSSKLGCASVFVSRPDASGFPSMFPIWHSVRIRGESMFGTGRQLAYLLTMFRGDLP